MRKQTTIPPVSIRHGKLQPSTRFPNEEAKNKAMKTNWRLGIDRPLYESTMHASQTMVAALPPEVLALKPPRVLKNSSNKAAIEGEGSAYRDPAVLYQTTQTSDFCKTSSVHNPAYIKGAPAFDRLNANRTNYSLSASDKHHDLRASSHSAHAHPGSWPARRGFEQPVIGGWTKPTSGEYVVDEYARASVRQGGGGGEGSLGVRFDIVTGASQPAARDLVALRTGPRVSLNVKDPWRMGANQFGELPEGKVNILSGQARPAPTAPPRATAEALRRPDENILRTRPW